MDLLQNRNAVFDLPTLRKPRRAPSASSGQALSEVEGGPQFVKAHR
jgi:hypothetical protein